MVLPYFFVNQKNIAMSSIKTNFSFLAKTLLKSVGVFVILLIAVNTIAYLSGIVSTGFYEENFSLFQQSAFSMEGLSISNGLGELGFIGLFVFTVLAVFANELKTRPLNKAAMNSAGRKTPVKRMKGQYAPSRRLVEKVA